MNYSVYSLGEIANITMGQSPPGDTYNIQQIGLPFFQGKAEFGDESPTPVKWCSKPTRIAEAGDILLSVRAPVGPTNIASERCCIGRGLAAIQGKDQIALTRYLLYFFRKFETEIANKGVGSTFAAINKNDIERLQIPLPPLAEQERIVCLLDEAEALRKLRAQASTRMDEFIPALFHEMFGDPAENEKKWDIVPLVDMSTKFSDGPFGSNLKTSHYRESGVRVVRLQNIGVGEFIDDDTAFISDEHFKTLNKHECVPGDVIVGTLGNPNLRACILPNYIPIALNKADCPQIRPNPKVATAEYICWLLNMPSTLELASGLIQGQTRARISMGRLRNLQVPLPPLPLQQEFSRHIQEAREIQSRQAQSAGRIEALYQSMLSRAFAGEL